MRILVILLSPLFLGGCVSIVKDVVTAPVRIVSSTADVLTTSQSEADEKRGRNLRKQEERLGEMSRKRDKAAKKCRKGDVDACQEMDSLDVAIDKERNRG